MKKFYVTMTSTAEYTVEAETEEEAIEMAYDWFSEREPDIDCEEMTEPNEDYEKNFKGTYSNEKICWNEVK